MMLFGLADSDPTATFTDPSGVSCRMFETVLDTGGQAWCDLCQAGGFDAQGNPISCQSGQVMTNASSPIVSGYTAPGSSPSVSQVAPVVASTSQPPSVSGYTQMTMYDANGNPVDVSCDAMGNCYDASGNQVAVQAPPTSGASAWLQNTFGPNWMTYVVGGLATVGAVLAIVIIARR